MSTETLAAPATPPAPQSIAALGEHARALRTQVARAFIGQTEVFEQVLLALLASGHVLIEGVPGLGKTLLVRALAASVGCSFGRVQFTPDLMPADVTGHAVYDPKAEASACGAARCSPTCCWPTRSTAPRPRPNRPCCRPCRSGW